LPGAVKAFSGHLSPEFDTVAGDSAPRRIHATEVDLAGDHREIDVAMAAAKCPITEVDRPPAQMKD
jgi:hypothetical protein